MNLVAVNASGFSEPSGYRTVVDSKAMRKVGANEDMVSVISLRSAAGARIIVEGRTLIQLH